MAVETISTPDVPLQLQACAPGGPGAIGTFQMTTNLVKTDGGQTDAVILANVLGQRQCPLRSVPAWQAQEPAVGRPVPQHAAAAGGPGEAHRHAGLQARQV